MVKRFKRKNFIPNTFVTFAPCRHGTVLKMAPRWRCGALILAVALGILQCCGWSSAQTMRTSVEMKRDAFEHSPMSHERVKRGWVWNQFFVVEEYTGTEPLYVGKVNV